MKIAEEILKIFADCRIEGNVLFLPPEQLDRKTYEAVNKCLANIGGKWDRKAKGHVFDDDPAEAFENLLLTGETEDMKKKFQFFPTPENIAEQMCDMAELTSKSIVLEPSCGDGALADVIERKCVNRLEGIELNSDMEKLLSKKPYPVFYGNFLNYKPRGFDRIIMNPPFHGQQDIDHIRHAFDILKPGGILVAVCSVSSFFRGNKKSVEFRAFLEEHGAEVVDIPPGAFKASGTAVPAKIIKIRKCET